MPPFVLLHGGFHGGWCWQPVARALRAAGHPVFTPTLSGLGERRHLLQPGLGIEFGVTDILAVLECEELSDVILVGHSLAGVILAALADRIPSRIRRLVFLDAVLVRNGSCALDYLTEPARAARLQAVAGGDGLCLPVPEASAFGLSDPAQRAWVQRRLTPQPLAPFTDRARLQHGFGNNRPCTYITCTSPLHSSVTEARSWAAQQPGWENLTLPLCHDAMVEDPVRTAALLLSLAQ